jgi:hypothetical protein
VPCRSFHSRPGSRAWHRSGDSPSSQLHIPWARMHALPGS